jgi:hypothetical protein
MQGGGGTVINFSPTYNVASGVDVVNMRKQMREIAQASTAELAEKMSRAV